MLETHVISKIGRFVHGKVDVETVQFLLEEGDSIALKAEHFRKDGLKLKQLFASLSVGIFAIRNVKVRRFLHCFVD